MSDTPHSTAQHGTVPCDTPTHDEIQAVLTELDEAEAAVDALAPGERRTEATMRLMRARNTAKSLVVRADYYILREWVMGA